MLLRAILADQFRLLTFRRPSALIRERWPAYLAFGFGCTWLAGIGRYWDNPKAHLWQYLGLGSIGYVFILALLLWLLLLPLRPKNWSYRNILLFLTLTSLPALLYAIPVEKFMTLRAAQSANAWFLAVVATWRVALLVAFLRRVAGLSGLTIVVATLLPLTVIVVALTTLNLEHVIFNIMAGIRDQDQSGNDTAYMVVLTLAYFSFIASPFLLVTYVWLALVAWHAPAPTLRPMTDDDLPMLQEWIKRPHVREWWAGDEADLPFDAFRAMYLPRVTAKEKVTPYIVMLDGRPIGYAQSYIAMGSGGGWWESETDPGVRGIDQFLAAPADLNRGFGTRMVKALVAQLFRDPSVTRIQTDPDPGNHRAIRCYEKAGFRAVRTITTPDGAALYMTQDRPR